MNRFARFAAGLPLALGLAANFFVPSTSADPIGTSEGAAVVIRHAVLWSTSGTGAARLGAVDPGDVVTLLPHGHRSGYVHVQTQEEETGWISDRSVRPIDEASVHQPTGATPVPPPAPTFSPPAPGAPAPDMPLLQVTSGTFDGCSVQGSPSPNGSRYQELLTLNQLKNRSAEPTAGDIDTSVSLAKLLAPTSDDAHRFSTVKAAEVVAFVYHVKPGGKTESTNCGNGGVPTDPDHRDTHIELVLSPTDTLAPRRVVVEITPRWRKAAAAAGLDWSTLKLQQSIEKHWVRVRGWLFYDAEHTNASESTNPGGASNWRATPWELHPIVGLTLVPHP